MRRNWPQIALLVFSAIGAAASVEALRAHYGTSDSTFCDIGAQFSCDVVNQSVYASFYGIPFALIGLIGYLSVFALTAINWRWPRLETVSILCALSTIGFAIQSYLTIIEATLIQVWCLMCLISQVAVTIILIAAWMWRKQQLYGSGANL